MPPEIPWQFPIEIPPPPEEIEYDDEEGPDEEDPDEEDPDEE
jgi:hypothetical protein